MSKYLRGPLCLQFPDHLALLGNAGVRAGGGVCLCGGRGWSRGGRSHAWLVVYTCLLLKLCLQRER